MTYTRTTVLDGSVRTRELSEVVTGHLRLNLNTGENLDNASRSDVKIQEISPTTLAAHLAVVDTHDTSNHLRHNNHIPQMRLHNRGLLIGRCFLLGLAQLFDKAHGAAFETTLEPSAGTSVYKFDELWERNIAKIRHIALVMNVE